jgi:hypothetical protein
MDYWPPSSVSMFVLHALAADIEIVRFLNLFGLDAPQEPQSLLQSHQEKFSFSTPLHTITGNTELPQNIIADVLPIARPSIPRIR